MKDNKSKIFKQRLFQMHIVLGILVSSFMYIAIFFGVFTVYLPYVKTWEKPSRLIEQVDITKVNYNPMINEVLEDPDFPRDDIMLGLPGNMGDPAVVVSHRFAKGYAFDPITNKRLNNETKEQSNLANFINALHYGAPLKVIGMVFFGFIALGALILIITGLILVSIIKFKNKGKTQQSFFSKVHIKIFSWLFIPLILISLTSAFMNIGLISSSPMIQILSKGETKVIDAFVGPILFPQNKALKRANETATMKPISELILIAQKINPELTFKQIRLMNWNNKNAQVEIIGYNPYMPFLNGGIFNRPLIILNAITGELIKEQKVMDKKFPVFVAEGLFFIHFLFGVDIISRTIMALLMALCGIGIGFGTMLYLEKKAKKFQDKVVFYHWIGKFSLASMIGILPATASLFVLQWLLPFDLEDRVIWQQGIFYNVWLFTLFWSFYKTNSYEAAKNFFFTAGILFMTAVILHLIHINESVDNLLNLPNILFVDISLVSLSILFIFIAKKLPNQRSEAKLFWQSNKGKKQNEN